MMNDRDLVFIVSAGRTGTKFLGAHLGNLIRNCHSEHEPDVLPRLSVPGNWPEAAFKIMKFGPKHMLLDRVRHRSGLRNLFEAKISGNITDPDDIVYRIYAHRERYYARVPHSLVIESCYQWYGLLPELRQAYPKAKVVAVVRDPRTWVGSIVSYTASINAYDPARILQRGRRAAPRIAYEAAGGNWAGLSTRQKACVRWATIYSRIADFVERDNQALTLHYEDLFDGDSTEAFEKLLNFAATHNGQNYAYTTPAPETLCETVNAAPPRTGFEEWPESDQTFLQELCGPLMTRFGYPKP